MASEGTTESSHDETVEREVKKAVEDLLKSLGQLQYTPTTPEETTTTGQVDCGDSQSSDTPNSNDSADTSFHSPYWSASNSQHSGDVSELEEEIKEDVKEDNHDICPKAPTGKKTEAGPLEYGEIPFEHLTDPENYKNEYFEVKKSRLGGFGAFAKKDLKRGEVILVEKPTLKANPWNFYGELEALAPELQATISRMHGHKRFYDQDPSMAKFMTNSFGVKGISCLYLIAAKFNHACGSIKSVDYRIVCRDIIKFTMRKDVPAGTELTISYGPLSPANLYSMWGFRCACGGCRPVTDEEVAKVDRIYEEGGEW
ncbi:hypothetical protein GGR53DRAFT_523992 [Hypoxylon sp. FL1150]|nr:hypothetical protein GGR53DRAFT_523992 [Hypoxylon sp. FL1150]